MENTNTDSNLFEMHFDERIKQSLSKLSVTSMLAVSISLVGTVISIVSFFLKSGKVSDAYQSPGIANITVGSGIVSLLVTLTLSIVLFSMVYRFYKYTKSGVINNDPLELNTGLFSLKNYFKMTGILLIIVLSFIVLALLVILMIGTAVQP